MAAATGEFGRRRRFLRRGYLSSSFLLLPSNLQFRCMKYLVCLVIYKVFLYPLGVQKISVMFLSGHSLEYLFWRFFLLFLDHGFASNFGSNGYNTRVAMGFHEFGW